MDAADIGGLGQQTAEPLYGSLAPQGLVEGGRGPAVGVAAQELPLLGVLRELDEAVGQSQDGGVDPGGGVRGRQGHRVTFVDLSGVDGLEDRPHPRLAVDLLADQLLVKHLDHAGRQRQGLLVTVAVRSEDVEGRRGAVQQHVPVGVGQAHQLHHRVADHVPRQGDGVEPAESRVLVHQAFGAGGDPAGQGLHRAGGELFGQHSAELAVPGAVGGENCAAENLLVGEGGEGYAALGSEGAGVLEDRSDVDVPGYRPHAVLLQVHGGTGAPQGSVRGVWVGQDAVIEEEQGTGGGEGGHGGTSGSQTVTGGASRYSRSLISARVLEPDSRASS